MTRPSKPVFGVTAPRVRPTVAGAVWVALVVSVPLAVLLACVRVVLAFLV
ncbi:MAG: hypothetical protein AAFN59_08605 [Pseudomonadota bacterium]